MRSKTAVRPYPGPRPFLETDQDRFFGRATDAAIVAEWWRHNNLTYVSAPAGRGKSSLLHAGVLPLMTAQKLDVLPVAGLSYGAAFPAAALPAHNPYALALLRSWAPGELAPRLAGHTLLDFFQRRAGDDVIFAAIDQADELLTETSLRQSYRRRLLRELGEALEREPRLHLLVVGREEAIRVISAGLGNAIRYEVPALSWPNAVDAVSRPMARTGKTLADGAAERLVTDARTSRIASRDGAERYVTDDYIEPSILQLACTQLWDHLPPDLDRISARDIRRYGDVDTALATYCGRTITQIADDHDLPTKRLTSWMLSAFVTELGTRSKAYEGATTTAGMPNAVPRALVDRHLLISTSESGSRSYELLHDRLIEPLRKATDMRMPTAEPEDYLRAAEHSLALGELDLAERYARELLRSSADPDLRLQAEAHSLLGNLAYEREKPEEAEGNYREAARRYTAAADSKATAFQLAAVGQALLAQGRMSEAVDELHGAVVRQPNEPALQTELAQALWQDDRGPAAIAILNDVLRMDGGNPAALRARGEILAYLGEARQAMRDLDRVNPSGQPSIRAARGLALAELGDRPSARREIEDAITEGQRNGPVLLYAARAAALSGDDSAAQELAEKAANATDPPLSPPHREVARQLSGRR